MKKNAKGKAGYIRYEKKKRLLLTILMFAIPLLIFISGWIYHGTRKNLLTLVAILGIIPAARFAVSCIMMMLEKPASEKTIEDTEQIAGKLVHAFELTVTAYEGRMPLEALVVCGNNVACFSSRGKHELIDKMEKHMAGILANNGYKQVNVKIFTEYRNYLGRIETLAADPEGFDRGISFVPDERYPDLTREELILHTLMAISL